MLASETAVWKPLCEKLHPVLTSVKCQPCFRTMSWRALLRQQTIADKAAVIRMGQESTLRRDGYMLGVEVRLFAQGQSAEGELMLSSLVELSAAGKLSAADTAKLSTLRSEAAEAGERERWNPDSWAPSARTAADTFAKKPDRTLACVRVEETEEAVVSLPLLNMHRGVYRRQTNVRGMCTIDRREDDGLTGWDPEHEEYDHPALSPYLSTYYDCVFEFGTTVFLMRKVDGKRVTLSCTQVPQSHPDAPLDAEIFDSDQADWAQSRKSFDGTSYEWAVPGTGGSGVMKNLVAQMGVVVHHETIWESDEDYARRNPVYSADDSFTSEESRCVTVQVTGVDVFLVPGMFAIEEEENRQRWGAWYNSMPGSHLGPECGSRCDPMRRIQTVEGEEGLLRLIDSWAWA